MLVLSRKAQETIVFPNLGITLEIVRIEGGKVRVGIEAPAEISVLRGELVNNQLGNRFDAAEIPSGEADRLLHHRLRNQLHTARLGLKLLEKQIVAGMIDEAEETLGRALGIFRQLDSELERINVRGQAHGCRALVVEDDANEAHLLAGILRMSGYLVETAQDGLQALERLKETRPDFVLLDMNMPRCDGRTTLASICANLDWRGLHIFAVTGCTQTEVGVTASELGVERWFQKPVDPEVILKAMKEADVSPCVSA